MPGRAAIRLSLGVVLALAAAAGSLVLMRGWQPVSDGPPRDPGLSAETPLVCEGSAGFAADDALDAAACDGVWLAPARRSFVPQGLVIEGNQAFVSGYREGELGRRYCQLLVADRSTGEVSAFRRRLTLDRGGEEIVCRHGGGLVRGPEGLWLAESSRLWLLDAQALRRGADPVRRVWRLERPVRGSALARRSGRLAVIGWAAHRRAWVHWVQVRDLLDDDAVQMGLGGGPGAVVPVAARRVPSRVQGAAWRAGGLLLARSTTYCGELVSRDGGTHAFFPGAEGISFADGRLWVVSESGSGVYQRLGGRPELPTLMSVRIDELDRSDGCGWD